MSFKTQIKNIAYSRLLASANPGPGQSVPEAVRASMESQAEDIAEAVANAQHASLVQGIETLCNSLQVLGGALSVWAPIVLDTGSGAEKAAVASAASAVSGAAEALKTFGGQYRA